MNAIDVILALWILATACADDQPWMFFAKVNDTYKPLRRIEAFIDDSHQIGLLSYGNSSDPLVEFTYQASYAKTEDHYSPGYAGFYVYVFVFGSSFPKTPIYLDDDKKIKSHRFYSCGPTSRHKNVISLIDVEGLSCVEVDIFLMPFDKRTGAFVNGLCVQEKTEKTPKAQVKESTLQEYPFVFFAKSKDDCYALSGNPFHNSSILSYGKPWAIPIEFTLHEGYAFTNDTSTPGYVGFDRYMFLFGPSSPKSRLKLNRKMRVENWQFYSCVLLDRSFNVLYEDVHPLCFEVEIYLLPYDRETGTVVKNWKHLPMVERELDQTYTLENASVPASFLGNGSSAASAMEFVTPADVTSSHTIISKAPKVDFGKLNAISNTTSALEVPLVHNQSTALEGSVVASEFTVPGLLSVDTELSGLPSVLESDCSSKSNPKHNKSSSTKDNTREEAKNALTSCECKHEPLSKTFEVQILNNVVVSGLKTSVISKTTAICTRNMPVSTVWKTLVTTHCPIQTTLPVTKYGDISMFVTSSTTLIDCGVNSSGKSFAGLESPPPSIEPRVS